MKNRNNKVLLRKLALERNIRPSSYAVFSILVDMADYKNLTCFPSTKYIADKINISTRTVFRALKELERVGLIYIKQRFETDKSNRQTSNLYTLIIPKSELDEIKKETNNSVFVYDKQKEPQNNEEKDYKEDKDADIENLLSKEDKNKYISYLYNEFGKDLKTDEVIVIKKVYKDENDNIKLDFYIKKPNFIQKIINCLIKKNR
ncbi:MAG: helix-turn-helix domain-containing protein [Lachnospiraceae bacterium]|nr:helix-turn-helix domain-containing protein [Lachnospiraceae bacterium]